MPNDVFRTNGLRPNYRGVPGYPQGAPIPGVAPMLRPDPRGAHEVAIPPGDGQKPFDPRIWEHHALAMQMGLERSLSSPRVRQLLQSMLDNMLRATWKPVVLPPWEIKPYNADYFGGIVADTMPAGSVWTTFDDGTRSLEFTVPKGRMAVIKKFAQGAQTADDWDSLCWRITINDIPQVPFDEVCCQIGQLHQPHDLTLIARPGSVIKVQGRNSSVAEITDVVALVYGWMWDVANPGDVLNAHDQASVA